MVHKLATIAVIGLATSAVCIGAAAAIGGPAFGEGFGGMKKISHRDHRVHRGIEPN